MATTIEQQVALDEALVPSTKSCPFFKAFLVTADVPKIYMQEFWATVYVHQHSIRFKLDNKKHIVDLETFRDMLHICPRIPGQSFDELPFEAEILEFLRFLGHSAQIRTLTDVNINKLFQPWRSFGAVINKCLTGKSSGFDRFRLSQAQILWGLYHSRNIDYAFLIWEDFVYQVEHKNHKKSNEMYYPRFTKVIVHHFMSKDLSIPRRKKTSGTPRLTRNITLMPLEKQHPSQTPVLEGKKSGSDTFITRPTAIITLTTTGVVTPRLTAAAKGKQPAKAKSPSDPSENMATMIEQQVALDKALVPSTKRLRIKRSKFRLPSEIQSKESTLEEESFDPIPRTPEDSEDDGNGEEDQGLRSSEEEKIHEEEEADELYRNVDINQGRGLQVSQDIKDSHVTLTPVHPDVAPLPTPIPTMTPSIITTITTASHPPIPPTPIPSEVLQNLPTFDSVYCFDERLKSLEANFSEYKQTNSFAKAVSNISGIVHQYMNQQLNEAVRVAVQIQTDRLRDSYQRENDEFLKTIDDNMKRIIKEQVKSQVKEQVSRILPRIEESVNA
nr:hypothetical protein [Tanacetum cinerariifolium]